MSLSKGLKITQIPLGTGGRIFLAKKKMPSNRSLEKIRTINFILILIIQTKHEFDPKKLVLKST